ncbi:MAG: response regulator [bacterium]
MAAEKILVIDDNANTRQLLKTVLENKGHQVDLAATTHDALAEVKRGQPNLIILLDIDGTKLLELMGQESQLSLVPVMILTSKKELENTFRGLLMSGVDQSPKSLQWEDLTTQVRNVLDLGKIRINADDVTNGNNASRRLLEYLEQKKITKIIPVGRNEARLGYEYPEAAKFLQPEVVGEEIVTLEQLAEKNHLDRVLYDLIHVCPSCGHHDLNFRDMCPQCKSIEVRTVDVIVHIKCGHRALEYEFHQNGQKICPACHRALSGEGVDFEKANRPVFECLKCKKIFSKAVVNCRCINCNRTFDASNTVRKKIYSYHFRNSNADDTLAEDIALLQNYFKDTSPGTRTSDKLPNIQMRIQEEFAQVGLETVDWQFFTQQLQQELKRCCQNDLKFSILKIAFVQEGHLDLEPEDVLPQPILKQLTMILKKCLRDWDLISIKTPLEYVILLPETPLSMAKILGQRIQNYLHKLQLTIQAEVSLAGYPEDGNEAKELLEVLNLELAILNPEDSQVTIQKY